MSDFHVQDFYFRVPLPVRSLLLIVGGVGLWKIGKILWAAFSS